MNQKTIMEYHDHVLSLQLDENVESSVLQHVELGSVTSMAMLEELVTSIEKQESECNEDKDYY